MSELLQSGFGAEKIRKIKTADRLATEKPGHPSGPAAKNKGNEREREWQE
jgi:hypothetical protein